MQRFTVPRDLYMGENALEALKTLKGKKAIIVFGSERMIKDGTIGIVQGYLKEAGIESELFSGVEADPSVGTVMCGAESMKKFQPDIIIGIGGGSPIDAAKAMWIFYEYPESTFEEIAKPFNLPELRKKAYFVAIPTTSGTGTEVTAFSVICDEKTGVKYPIADFNITPDIAILDTNLVKGLTKTLVANTGMDALTHSLEAIVSTVSNPLTDCLAMKAIEMVVSDIIPSYNGDEKARNNMHLAQCLAGMSFSNAILGIVHSMAHKTGKIFDVPHGMANAIYLPYVIEYNAKNPRAKAIYADVAKRLGLKANSEDEFVEALIKLIRSLKKELNMPDSLKEYGVSEDCFLKELDYISEHAVEDPCTGTNPREIDTETMKKMFKAVYYGEDVKF